MTAPRVQFTNPHGRLLEHVPAATPGRYDTLITTNTKHGITPDDRTAVPGWNGERLDLDMSTLAFLTRCGPQPRA